MAVSIQLDGLHIEHFKGLREQDISFAPGQTDIYGDNATGKTTLFDAVTWLLFGKDSHNQTTFGIKPVNAQGAVADHGVRSAVEAAITINGEPHAIRKEYAEKWTKKRGSASPVFSGHETKCFIDGVPKTATQYNAFINRFIDEGTFRLLSSPEQFAGFADWKARRKVLMEISGDVTTEDVLKAFTGAQRADLEQMLARYSPDDATAVLKAERTKLNKALQELPVRIDEAVKTLPEEIDTAYEEREMLSLQEEATKITHRMHALARDSGRSTKLAEITAEIGRLKQEDDAAELEHQRAWFDARTAHSEKVQPLVRKLYEQEQAAECLAMKAQKLGEAVDDQRAEYREARALAWTEPDTCPTCGQKLPEEQIEEKRSAFNIAKSEKLERITEKGRKTAGELEDAQERLAAAEALVAQTRAQLEAIEAEAPKEPAPYTRQNDERIAQLMAEREMVQNATAPNAEEVAALSARQKEYQVRIREHESRIAQAKAGEKTRARVEELRAQERLTAQQIEVVDRKLGALEDFTRARIRVVEERVNDKFRIVRWKLFSEQINGGLTECCELTANGVPWGDLNSGMKILAGCDVINTLSEHYDARVPVFIDNAESLTTMPDLGENQLIRLVVSEPDKELRVVQEVA